MKMISLLLCAFISLTLCYCDTGEKTKFLIFPGADGKDAGAFGTISFDKSTYQGTISNASITLLDSNLTSTSINVNVSSTSNAAGISVNLTGSNGEYSGTVGFTKSTSGGGRIHISDGDTVMVSYNDENPIGIRSATATWEDFDMNPTGVISFNTDTYFGTTQTATIVLTDSDLTGTTVNVNVKSTTDSSGITVALNGSGGVYSNSVGFTTGSSGSGNIRVSDGDTITVTYNDANPAGTRTDTAIWNSTTHGVVYFDSDKYSSSYGLTITVRDADVLSTTVDVLLTSTSDPSGITVTLNETTENGVYQRYFRITPTGTSGSNCIKAISGDHIYVTYNEVSPAGTRTDIALYTPISGSVSFGDTTYYGLLDKAIINVYDWDLTYYDYDSYVYGGPESVDITVVSTSDPTGVTIKVFRINNVYRGCVGFTSGSSGDGKIHVVEGDTVTVRYSEPYPVGTRTDTAVWHE